MLRMTVYVMRAPRIPPTMTYLGDTCISPAMGSLPVKSQITTQVMNAVSCTQPAATHTLVCFVTSVLNTPCMLINAPDSNAMTNPISFLSCLSIIFPVSLAFPLNIILFQAKELSCICICCIIVPTGGAVYEYHYKSPIPDVVMAHEDTCPIFRLPSCLWGRRYPCRHFPGMETAARHTSAGAASLRPDSGCQ